MPKDDEDVRTARCACGKIALFFSSLFEKVYCSDECYEKDAGVPKVSKMKYVAHGVFEVEAE
jgi:hypothetical protein